MGFNGEILVGHGEAFTGALGEFWSWEEEVVETWALNDGWQAVHVRSPAEDDEREAVAEVEEEAAPVYVAFVMTPILDGFTDIHCQRIQGRKV